MNYKVGVIMGSDSDLPVLQDACDVLEEFQIPYEVDIVSAHRTPEKMYQYAQEAKNRGIKVIIAGAGGAAHLPGMVASLTELPVIGVPIKTRSLSGMDSLYSIVQMPAGVPVATVAINGAKNAALLAARMIGSYEERVSQALNDYQEQNRQKVLEKGQELQKIGHEQYLKRKEES
ncbi:5-(carboxyamino)imidazole ribonucleotide mutase [Natranaerobius thermophilus]|uniref:N5-carboxyaminoimidazole ribonucleotide mutase n=1 Tax=Natranaerobius thermophilus (strain ATCC BAA-1301 / DSM 18059 / JW/NM-WN-LF) TaxID=457570 RepID=B2A5V7_NATTJ|nr:5-(carboxyamino)imidazole ribonucleotide mutase [Natranaerobius thermophilus]ACB84050.1 phosphoribosylaminoimidazole carboxylase, catalytic subunit [Natranaerobius thermophilus JW/NM-WN-LF]